MYQKTSFVSVLRSISFATLACAIAMSSGCGGIPAGGAATPLGTYSGDSSWALKIASHTSLARQEGMMFDVESEEELEQVGRSAGSGIGTMAVVGAGLSAKSSVLASANAMDLVLGLSMLSGAGTTPDAHAFAASTLTWFPADQASSPADARDKFHAMRVSNITSYLAESGIKYKVSNLNMPSMLVGPIFKLTQITAEGLVNGECIDCIFVVRTMMPAKQTVMAPKELLGYEFPAYKFRARSSADSRSGPQTSLLLKRKLAERELTDDNGPYAHIRDPEFMAWASALINPPWAVEYVPYFKPETLLYLESKGYPVGVTYGYMVHKGEIKRFIKGQ